MTPSRTPWRPTAACLLAAPAALILLATIVPPFSMLLFPASIGGTELAPLFLVIGALAAGLAWPAVKLERPATPAPALRRWRSTALILAAVTLLLSLRTLVQVPGAVARAETTMDAAFGEAYAQSARRPDAVRSAPIDVGEVFSGLRLPEVAVDPGRVLSISTGETLRADLFRPPGAGPHPVVIAIHGGAWSSGTRREGATCHRALAASGFLVVAIDYRLAPATRFPGQLDDVRAAIAWIRAHAGDYNADPARLAVLGRSAGAQLALLAAYAPGSGIRAAVAFYSPVDFSEGYRHPSVPDPLDTRQVFEDYLGGSVDELPERYREASPITHADAPRPPTLLINGGRDHLIHLRFGELLAARLQAHGTAVALIDLPWSEHAFDAIPHGLGGQLALHHIERFLWTMLGSTAADGSAHTGGRRPGENAVR